MNKENVIIGVGATIGFILVMGAINYYPKIATVHRLQDQCQSFGENYVKENDYDSKIDEVDFFYSKKLDTCLMGRQNELENTYTIRDIQMNFLKDIKALFWCDKDGVDNVILEKAIQHDGYLMNTTFTDFLDDGNGGQARAVKTPDAPYTRDDCKKAYEKKLLEVK
jgi:hypothetical protein